MARGLPETPRKVVSKRSLHSVWKIASRQADQKKVNLGFQFSQKTLQRLCSEAPSVAAVDVRPFFFFFFYLKVTCIPCMSISLVFSLQKLHLFHLAVEGLQTAKLCKGHCNPLPFPLRAGEGERSGREVLICDLQRQSQAA